MEPKDDCGEFPSARTASFACREKPRSVPRISFADSETDVFLGGITAIFCCSIIFIFSVYFIIKNNIIIENLYK